MRAEAMMGKRPRWRAVVIGLASAMTFACGDPGTEPGGGPPAAPPDRAARTGVFDTPQGRAEIPYEIIDGHKIAGGDMILPPELEPPFQHSAGLTAFSRRWPNGLIPIEDSNLARDPRVSAAIARWMIVTGIRMPIVQGNVNRIIIEASSDPNVCTAHHGFHNLTVAHKMKLGSNCSVETIVHELGHVIGLFHEHQRTDRNQFIRVFDGTLGRQNCILPGKESFFKRITSDGILNFPDYDLKSIMQYTSVTFLNTSIPGCTATITGPGGSTIPFNSALTGFDMAGAQSLYLAFTMSRQPVDYDGDGKADIATWRPSDNTWRIRQSRSGAQRDIGWGNPTDLPVPGEYDGDGKIDITVWRPATGNWHVLSSRDNREIRTQWGQNTDVPVPGDYDGDRKTDIAVWRPVPGTWFILGRDPIRWGEPGDIPVPADYDGDGVTDLAVFRPNTGAWWVIHSTTGASSESFWGQPGDIPLPGHYDALGSGADFAYWRPFDGTWHVQFRRNGQEVVQQWGEQRDQPTPADFDGDGVLDFAVFRPTDFFGRPHGEWFIINSSNGARPTLRWGTSNDVPVP